jgi:murein DD-endopeptidase MepM/ murein hydrolase activator NlpD
MATAATEGRIMRPGDQRAVSRRGLAYIIALVLCLGSTLATVDAQDVANAPVAGPAIIASAGEPVLLRESPGFDAAVVMPLGDGSELDVAGAAMAAGDGSLWLPVVAYGQSGYVPAGYVTSAAGEWVPSEPAEPAALMPALPEPVAAPDAAPMTGAGATTTEANLRAGPGPEFEVLGILPPATAVSIDGVPENGYIPVSANGISGWVAVDLVAGGTAPGSAAPLPAPVTAEDANPVPADVPAAETVAPAPAQAPAAASSESTGIIWPFAGGEWKVVQGYNGGTHQNRGGFAQYHYSLDWARVDGNTAGQPVFAPVSGTVDWTDRGSGGVLIDAGNGYGVALFHVTLDGSAARGNSVSRGQPIGTISGPGGDGYMSMAHIEIAAWRLYDGGHESVPFVGPNAIAGMEFPDNGGANQHMGATVTP